MVSIARATKDPDLEILALMRRGACAINGGDVQAGLSDVHEAMAAATSGEGHDVQYFAEALCSLLEVAGTLGGQGAARHVGAMLQQTTGDLLAAIPSREPPP